MCNALCTDVCVCMGLQSHKCASYNSTNVAAKRHECAIAASTKIHTHTYSIGLSLCSIQSCTTNTLIFTHTHRERIRYWQKWNVMVAIHREMKFLRIQSWSCMAWVWSWAWDVRGRLEGGAVLVWLLRFQVCMRYIITYKWMGRQRRKY